MKKKLTVLLVCLCLALGVTGTALTAFAGVNTNSPTGEGLLAGGGLSNNYVLNGNDEVFSYQTGNSVYSYAGAGGHHTTAAWNTIPLADITDNNKFVMQVDVYEMGTPGAQAYAFAPFYDESALPAVEGANQINSWDTTMIMLKFNSNTTIYGQIVNTGAEPTYWVDGEQIQKDAYSNLENFGLEGNLYDKLKADNGWDYVTYWFEADPSDSCAFTIYTGREENGNIISKTKHGTIKNAYANPTGDKLSWIWMPGNDIVFDNYKLYRTATGGATSTYNAETDKMYRENDFESASSITSTANSTDKLICLGGNFITLDAVVRVTNPTDNDYITTVNPLNVDELADPSFEMTASFRLENLAEDADRKVGVAFGLRRYTSSLAKPGQDASFIYFTVEDGKVMLGADNIAADGTVTTLENKLELGTKADLVKASAPFITLEFTGAPDGSVEVKAGEETVTFEGLNVAGVVAITHSGTGNVTYSVKHDDFGLTGYTLSLNEGEKITSSFDGGWMSPAKFNMQNTIAPDAHVTATDKSHAVTGMVPENGKLGFYGTSTNTVLTFANPYADFVMQFDYISIPYAQRGKLGGIETGNSPNRFAPLYIGFGAPAGISPLADFYAIGIIEGNATQYFWGAESLITPEGKLAQEGATLEVVSGVAVAEESDVAIPNYGVNPNGDSPKYTVNGYIKPSDEKATFYNKTTRFKLVVINNNVALYAADVNETGEAGEYRKVVEYKVKNSFGYVGLVGESPTWCEIDNLAITPIAKEVALEKWLTADPAVDLVADIPVSEMDADNEPTPLDRVRLTADTANKKVTWSAVENAAEYKVTVRFGGNTTEKTVNTTEIDMSDFNAVGEYTVEVIAVPEDLQNYQESIPATVKYTVTEEMVDPSKPTNPNEPENPGTTDPGNTDNGDNDSDAGCGCDGSVTGASALAGVALLGIAVFAAMRKKRA